MAESLHGIGFRDHEVFAGYSLADRLVFKGKLDAESTNWVFDSGSLNAVTLDMGYAQERDLQLERIYHRVPPFEFQPPGTAGYTRLKSLTAFGVELGDQTVPVYNLFGTTRHRVGEVAGVIGLDFFRGGAVAIDPQKHHLAYSSRPEVGVTANRYRAVLDLTKKDQRVLPVTSSVADALASDSMPPLLVLDTGMSGSILTLDYVMNRPIHPLMRLLLRAAQRFKRRVRYVFALPDATTVAVRVGVVKSTTAYAESVGLPRVDGVLGMNFLRRWLCHFDLRRATLGLGDMPALSGVSKQ